MSHFPPLLFKSLISLRSIFPRCCLADLEAFFTNASQAIDLEGHMTMSLFPRCCLRPPHFSPLLFKSLILKDSCFSPLLFKSLILLALEFSPQLFGALVPALPGAVYVIEFTGISVC